MTLYDPYADLREPGVECRHGTLVRKCEPCWLEREVRLLRPIAAAARAFLAAIEPVAPHTYDIANVQAARAKLVAALDAAVEESHAD